jgi:hypothetical protein
MDVAAMWKVYGLKGLEPSLAEEMALGLGMGGTPMRCPPEWAAYTLRWRRWLKRGEEARLTYLALREEKRVEFETRTLRPKDGLVVELLARILSA